MIQIQTISYDGTSVKKTFPKRKNDLISTTFNDGEREWKLSVFAITWNWLQKKNVFATIKNKARKHDHQQKDDKNAFILHFQAP